MKKVFSLLLLVALVLSLPATVLAQTGGTGGEATDARGPYVLSDTEEEILTFYQDILGYGPAGATRVGVSYAYAPGILSVNTMDEFGVACSAVTVYMMNDIGQLIPFSDYTCDGDVLSFEHKALTHFYYFAGVTGTPQLVSLHNAG